MPARFAADKRLVELAESIDGVHTGLIVSGDWFVDTKGKMGSILDTFADAKAVDMESGSIAQACHIYGVPFISFRVISDIPLDDTKGSQYFDFWDKVAEESFSVTKQFIEKI
jgi:adenosylhomocysteine nucleosidase